VGLVQIREVAGHPAVMQDVMAPIAQSEVALRVVGLAAVDTGDKVMDLQRSASVALWPPAHRTTAVQLDPFQQLSSLCGVHAA
jgi:hypothetical protein